MMIAVSPTTGAIMNKSYHPKSTPDARSTSFWDATQHADSTG